MDLTRLNCLQQNSKWKASSKYWYQRYFCRIVLSPVHSWDRSSIKYLKDTYPVRTKRRYDHDLKAEVVTVYTNDLDCVDYALKCIPNVSEINTPVGDEHITYLQSLPYWDHRNTPYYGKYHYKITSFPKNASKWGFQNNHQSYADIEKFLAWCNLTFKGNGRIRQQNYGNIYSYYYCCPYIYTDDEASIMMLKLNWGDKFKFTVEQVFTGKV